MASTQQAKENQNAGGLGAPSHLRLHWRHDFLRLKIGKNYYDLRTMSLLEAVQAQRHIGPLLEALRSGTQPLLYAQHLAGLVKVLCPMMLNQPEDVKALTLTQLLAVIEFYSQQDWALLDDVKALSSVEAEDEEAGTPQLSEKAIFYSITAACADKTGMPLPDFLDARLEFALDSIVTLAQEYQRRKAEGRTSHSQFVAAMAHTMGAKQYNEADDTSPEWMKDLARMADAAAAEDAKAKGGS